MATSYILILFVLSWWRLSIIPGVLIVFIYGKPLYNWSVYLPRWDVSHNTF